MSRDEDQVQVDWKGNEKRKDFLGSVTTGGINHQRETWFSWDLVRREKAR